MTNSAPFVTIELAPSDVSDDALRSEPCCCPCHQRPRLTEAQREVFRAFCGSQRAAETWPITVRELRALLEEESK
jgi:hypothetical protein